MKTSNLYPPTSDPRPPMVSVVVTTKNEERNIEHCMKSIKLQSYENVEIIVVDNFSTDKTKEIALKYTNKVYDKGPERSAQRNFGMMDIAKGKYVMFVDADMILSPSLVEACVIKLEQQNAGSHTPGAKNYEPRDHDYGLRAKSHEPNNINNNQPLASSFHPEPSTLQHPKRKTQNSSNCFSPSAFSPLPNSHRPDPMIVALHIPEIVLGKKYFSKVRRFERSFYDGTVIDGARFFLKEAFVKTGGFDESMSGPEDWDIDKKIKQIGKIVLLNYVGANSNPPNWKLYNFISQSGVNPLNYGSVIYHSEDEFNLKKYIAKKGYYAKSFDRYIEKWGNNDPDVKKQFSLWYRYLGVFFEKGKWKKLIENPTLVLGMYILRLMIGLLFLMRKFNNTKMH